MYRIFYQKLNKIGISLEGELLEREFEDVIRQIEITCEAYPGVDILIDASEIRDFKPDLIADTYDSLIKHRADIRKVAVLSKNGIGAYLRDLFKNFEDTDFKTFKSNELDKARDWALSPDPTRIYK